MAAERPKSIRTLHGARFDDGVDVLAELGTKDGVQDNVRAIEEGHDGAEVGDVGALLAHLTAREPTLDICRKRHVTSRLHIVMSNINTISVA